VKWSLRLGRLAGIDIYLHATFGLLIGFVVLQQWLAGEGPTETLISVLFVLALFGCVLLHELGHALAARAFGIPTRDITLLPIGGLARLERMPDEPLHELWVAIAGPIVNVVIAAAIYAGLVVAALPAGGNWFDPTAGGWLQRLMAVNVLLVVFNLLPAFPMDGGRVLRALLAIRLDYVRATQIAAGLGQAMALLFAFVGLMYNPFLLFIALFVWIGAAQESHLAQMKAAFGGLPLRVAMQTDFRTLSPQQTLADAIDLILSGSQQDFPVEQDGRLVGVLTRGDLLVGLARDGAAQTVDAVMRRDFLTGGPGDLLEATFRRLAGCECHTLPVVWQGRVVGLITMDNLGEFMMIQGALEAARRRRRRWW
jgi:Zn-dependent protease